jgi:hypothetical protein
VKPAKDVAACRFEITKLWPTVVLDNIVFQCLKDYRNGTVVNSINCSKKQLNTG